MRLGCDLIGRPPLDQAASRALLTITVIEGDDLPVQERQAELWGNNYRIVTYGCSVSTKGRVSYFQYDSGGFKGSGYPVLPKHDLKQLRLLAANLPDDHSQLPPPGRRLIIEAAISGKRSVRVYDRRYAGRGAANHSAGWSQYSALDYSLSR